MSQTTCVCLHDCGEWLYMSQTTCICLHMHSWPKVHLDSVNRLSDYIVFVSQHQTFILSKVGLYNVLSILVYHITDYIHVFWALIALHKIVLLYDTINKIPFTDLI